MYGREAPSLVLQAGQPWKAGWLAEGARGGGGGGSSLESNANDV